MSNDLSANGPPSLAAIAARLGAWVQAQSKAQPLARVRLDRPLDGPALAPATAVQVSVLAVVDAAADVRTGATVNVLVVAVVGPDTPDVLAASTRKV